MDNVEALNAVESADQLRLPGTKQIYSFWQSLTADGVVPAREDFDPADLGRWLANLSMIDVTRQTDGPGAKDDLFFRIIGTRIAEAVGRDDTGKWLSEVGYNDERREIQAFYLTASQSDVPMHSIGDFIDRPDKPRTRTAERLLLPFKRTDSANNSLLVGIFFLPEYVTP